MGLLLKLFLTFAKVGLFSFGGAYGAIPLIRDVVITYGWMDEEMLSNMIAVSESTPGPIMVNLATYIGSSKGGLPGAIIATLAVILAGLYFGSRKVSEKGLSPIMLIVISAVGGIIAYGI